MLSSAGAVVLALGYLIPLAYLLWSLRWGKPAGPNPWNAAGLEWMIPSPPPKHNFSRIPRVDFEAYTYPPERPGQPPSPTRTRTPETERREGEGGGDRGRGIVTRPRRFSPGAPPLNEPFVDAARQREAALVGLWAFLATEALLVRRAAVRPRRLSRSSTNRRCRKPPAIC